MALQQRGPAGQKLWRTDAFKTLDPTEKGAVNYIENLGSKRGKAYIADWESEQLKLLFKDVRNPQGHGSGSAPPLVLGPTQAEFVIEAAMSWIKSLITRP